MVQSDERLLDAEHVLQLERAGLVTATFRRLDPERQQAIASALLAEAIERGPSQVRIKEVARTAGVSVGSLYQYFADRDHLLQFALELCGWRLAADLAGLIPALTELPLREGLAAWVLGGMEWSQSRAAILLVFARGAYDGDPLVSERLVRPVATVMLEAIRGMVDAAVRRGEVRPNVDAEAVARTLNTLLIGLGDSQLLPHLNDYFRTSDADVPFERTLAAAIDLVTRGLAS